MKPLAPETNFLGIGVSATQISGATVVRLVNTSENSGTVQVLENDAENNYWGPVIGSITVPAGEVVYIQKKSEEWLSGDSFVNYTQVAYSHMMSYASYTAPQGYVTDNLQFHIDAGSSSSYSGGTTVYNLIHNDSSSTYNSNISYSTNNGGYWTFASNTGSGFKFDIGGGNNYLSFLSNDFTVEVWFRPNNTGLFLEYTKTGPFSGTLSDYPQLVGWLNQQSATNPRINLLTYYSTSNNNGWGFHTDNYISQNSWSENTSWIHHVVTSDASSLKRSVYKNGIFLGSATNSNFGYVRNSSDNDLYIGGSGVYNFPFVGDISIMRVYIGKALSSAEVTQNYNAEKSRYGL